MKTTLWICLVGLMTACSVAAPDSELNDAPGGPATGNESLEVLAGYQKTEAGIVFRVESNGCTSKESFRYSLMKSLPYQIELYRLERDPCERVPFVTEMFYSHDELGVINADFIEVRNPVKSL